MQVCYCLCFLLYVRCFVLFGLYALDYQLRDLLLSLIIILFQSFLSSKFPYAACFFLVQVLGSWKARNQNMSDLCTEAKKLKDRFLSFQMMHVLRVSVVYSASCLCSILLVHWLNFVSLIKFELLCTNLIMYRQQKQSFELMIATYPSMLLLRTGKAKSIRYL